MTKNTMHAHMLSAMHCILQYSAAFTERQPLYYTVCNAQHLDATCVTHWQRHPLLCRSYTLNTTALGLTLAENKPQNCGE